MAIYILVCIVFPPALVAQPVFFYLWFKRAERDARKEYIRARLQYQRHAAAVLIDDPDAPASTGFAKTTTLAELWTRLGL